MVPGRTSSFDGAVFEDDVDFGMFGLKAFDHSPSVILTVVINDDDFLDATDTLLSAARQSLANEFSGVVGGYENGGFQLFNCLNSAF